MPINTVINVTGASIQFGTGSGGSFSNNANSSIIGSPTVSDAIILTAVGGLTLAANVTVNGTISATSFVGTATGNLTSASSLDATKLSGVVPNTSISGAYTGLTSITSNVFVGNLTGTADVANLVRVNGDYASDAVERRVPWMDVQVGTAGNRSMFTTASFKFAPSTGTLTATKVMNAVWNDIADYIEVEADTEIEFGKAYVYANGRHRKSASYAEKGVLGIASDTLGFGVGKKDDSIPQIPIALGGFVLAFIDSEYESGTPLTCTTDGILTEMDEYNKRDYPERIVATFYKPERAESWNGVEVKGRHWVKIH